MAYTIHMILSCDVPLCEKRAVVRVYNTLNSLQGQFCRRHGEKRRKELEKSEAAMVRAVVAERDENKSKAGE